MNYARAYASGEWVEVTLKDGFYHVEISNQFRKIFFAVCKHLGEVKDVLKIMGLASFGEI